MSGSSSCKRGSDELDNELPTKKKPKCDTKPIRPEDISRGVATARTISLIVKLPQATKGRVTELMCEYMVDAAKRKETFQVDPEETRVHVITLGMTQYLGLSTKVSHVRVKAKIGQDWAERYAQGYQFDGEQEPHLCCSPLEASLEELQAELQPDEHDSDWGKQLRNFLNKKLVKSQLVRLVQKDLQIKGQVSRMNNEELINQIIDACSSGPGAAATTAINAAAVAKDAFSNAAKEKEKADKVCAGADKGAAAKEGEAAQAAEKVRRLHAELTNAQKESAMCSDASQQATTKACAAREDKESAIAELEEAQVRQTQLVQMQAAVTNASNAKREGKLPSKPGSATAMTGASTTSANAPTDMPEVTSVKLKNCIRSHWPEKLQLPQLQQMKKAVTNKKVGNKPNLQEEIRRFTALELNAGMPDPSSVSLGPFTETNFTDLYEVLQTNMKDDRGQCYLWPPYPGTKPFIAWVKNRLTPANAAPDAPQNRRLLSPLHMQTVHPDTLDRAKRATVRIGLLDTKTKRLFTVGSGTVIRGACGAFAQVLTCAHIFLDVHGSKPFTLFGSRPKQNVEILIGEYVRDEDTSMWRYHAELETPDELLLEKVRFGTGETLLDLAVLRVDRGIEVVPPEFQGMTRQDATYELGPPQRQYEDPGNLCPLRERGLVRGSTDTVTTGSTVSALGWYCERGEKTSEWPVCDSPDHHSHRLARDILYPADGCFRSLCQYGLEDPEQG